MFAGIFLFLVLIILAPVGCNRSSPGEKAPPPATAEHGGEAHGGHEGEHGHAHEEPAGLLHVDSAIQSLMKLATEKATVGEMPAVITAPATISPNMNHTAKVASKVKGRAIKVFVNPGDPVKSGQALALLSSSEVGEARSSYLQAKARMELARANLDRQKSRQAQAEILQAKARMMLAEKALERQRRLYENKIAPKKDLEAAEAEYENAKAAYEYAENILYRQETHAKEAELAAARADYEKARQTLLLMGVRPEEFAEEVSSSYSIRAPLSGTVIERKVNVGELVDENVDLFTIMDLSQVWVFAEIYENLLPQVRLGQEVRVKVPPYPDQTFRGRIRYISPVVDPHTRTVKVRADLENPSLLLKPEMFGEAQIITGVKKEVISVPEASVVDEEGEKSVFVKVGDGFLKRVVEVGTRFEGRVEITSGLGEEEEVVTNGAFQLKAQAMKGAGVAGTHAEHEHAGHEH
ncbi:MAG: efflux RND transporter periplasmic adaptor subunit [candidate division NC10 bacterium]|nr:efflux RND transporter periplasmic adaptor subunit [candidate division NC10 bacterium]